MDHPIWYLNHLKIPNSLRLILVNIVNLKDIIWCGGLQFRKAWKLVEFITGKISFEQQ